MEVYRLRDGRLEVTASPEEWGAIAKDLSYADNTLYGWGFGAEAASTDLVAELKLHGVEGV